MWSSMEIYKEKLRKEVIRVKLIFKKEKETKNCIRFEEVGEKGKPPVIGTIYVQKWFAGDLKELKLEILEKQE